jgi:hypothetical protein
MATRYRILELPNGYFIVEHKYLFNKWKPFLTYDTGEDYCAKQFSTFAMAKYELDYEIQRIQNINKPPKIVWEGELE